MGLPMQQKVKTEIMSQLLISRNNPIPVRRSHHLPMKGNNTISAKVFLRASNQEMMELTELTLSELESQDVKPSLSAHIHRDGGIHIALTEKVTNKCDQITLPAPSPSTS